jgi:hypothetical protein
LFSFFSGIEVVCDDGFRNQDAEIHSLQIIFSTALQFLLFTEPILLRGRFGLWAWGRFGFVIFELATDCLNLPVTPWCNPLEWFSGPAALS